MTGRTIVLSAIASNRVELQVTPAALEEADGGVELRVTCWRGTALEETTCFTLTATEARLLVEAVAETVRPGLFRLPEIGWE